MSWLSRLRRAVRPAPLDDELEEELQFHLEARIEELVASGLPREEARTRARRQFGSPLRHREASREAKLLPRLEALLADTRFGLRMLRRDGRITAAVVLSLGLAMGACTAAFSLWNALVLRPLPVREPKRLLYFSYTQEGPEGSTERAGFSYPFFERAREAGRPLVQLFGMSYQGRSPASVDGAGAEREWVQAQWISGDAFETLGLRPVVGRLLTAEDDRRPGQHPVAVLAFDYWQRRFGGSEAALGRWLTIGEHSYQVVGVLERSFRGAEPGIRTNVWLPNMMWSAKALANPHWSWFRIWGRLEPGASAEGVRARLQALFSDFRRERSADFPKDAPAGWLEKYLGAPLHVHSAANGPSELRGEFEQPLLVVAGVATLVLLIAGSNVTNLLLARGAAREREMALRLSIGAGRARLVQQLLVESGLLAVGACAFGLVIALAMAPLMVRLLNPATEPAWLDVGPDPHILGFLALLATATTLLFGLVPALRTSGVSPGHALRRGDVRHSGAPGMLRPLLAVQVGFSFLVLFGAGLLVISFHRLSSVDLGFAAEKLLIVRVETEVPEDEGRAARWQQVVDTLRQLPGIEAVSHSAWELFGGSGWSSAVRIPGRAIEASEPYFLQVSPGFLATMRIPLLEGRDFDDHDREPVKNRVVLVNEAFARRYFPDGSALGRSFFRLESATEEVSQEIVGVVRNARYRSLREPAPPTVYLPHRPEARATLQVRARADLAALALDLPQRVRKADPGFRVNEVVPQATLVSDTALRERLLALLSAFFAAVALLLVAVGLYGVMSYSVVRRTREIGIRMALGAQRAAVVRLVVGEVALVVAMGLAVGLGAGLAGARLLASLLFEVRPADLVSLGLPLAGLLLASILSILPAARRAVRVDPITALRCD